MPARGYCWQEPAAARQVSMPGLPQLLMRAVALQGLSQGRYSSPRRAEASQMRLEGTLTGSASASGAIESLSAIDAALVARGVRWAPVPVPLALGVCRTRLYHAAAATCWCLQQGGAHRQDVPIQQCWNEPVLVQPGGTGIYQQKVAFHKIVACLLQVLLLTGCRA